MLSTVVKNDQCMIVDFTSQEFKAYYCKIFDAKNIFKTAVHFITAKVMIPDLEHIVMKYVGKCRSMFYLI